MGRIEHTLLDGEFSVRPNRPKTFARNPIIPQKVTNISICDKGSEPRSVGAPTPGLEAGAPSTGELWGSCRCAFCGVPVPPGVVVVAPPEVPRNAKGRAKGSRRETHGQGQYKGRGFRAPAL